VLEQLLAPLARADAVIDISLFSNGQLLRLAAPLQIQLAAGRPAGISTASLGRDAERAALVVPGEPIHGFEALLVDGAGNICPEARRAPGPVGGGNGQKQAGEGAGARGARACAGLPLDCAAPGAPQPRQDPPVLPSRLAPPPLARPDTPPLWAHPPQRAEAEVTFDPPDAVEDARASRLRGNRAAAAALGAQAGGLTFVDGAGKAQDWKGRAAARWGRAERRARWGSLGPKGARLRR
jgi:hypothetical protein